MRLRGELEITTLGSSSWMPYALQGVKELDGDDDECCRAPIFEVSYSPVKIKCPSPAEQTGLLHNI